MAMAYVMWILKSLSNYIKSKNIVTLTAVRPPARFGGIKISGPKEIL